MLFCLLFRSRRTLTAAGLAFFILGALVANPFNINIDIATRASAAPTTMNFTKITYNTIASSDQPRNLVTALVSGTFGTPPASQPMVWDSIGLGNNPNPNPSSGNGFATTRKYTVHNLGSSGEDGGLRLDVFDGPGNVEPLPTHIFLDLFDHFSLPDSNGDPTNVATTRKGLTVHNLGSSGQDGVEIKFFVSDPHSGFDIPVTITCTIPAGQGLSFENPPFVSSDPLTVDALDGTPGDPTFSSFFDIFTELTITGPLDPNLPLLSLTTTLDTPEPASFSLLALSIPLLLKRRKK